MKMGVFLRRGARREEGMALLFALGFLALMLILGLGFVTTSLLSQKIAANNSSRAQARMFARSAMARAMLNVMLYNDQAVLKGKTVESYDWICSYDKADYNDGPGDGTDNVVSSGELSDQLHKSGDAATDGSKFKYQPGTEESYTGEDSKAKWLFFYDAPEGIEGRRIIGRAAYQVLPREAAGRLSLYAVTGGSKVRNDYGAYPRDFRWGRDVAELNLAPTLTLPNWYDKVDENNLPFKYGTMYTSYGSFFKAAGDSDAQKKEAEHKKRWLEYWFAEGKGSILKDAFPVKDDSGKIKYYHRFNISRFFHSGTTSAGSDNWYERFRKIGQRTEGWTDEELAQNKNSAAALEKLAQNAREYKESQAEDAEVEPSGLPFLKCIGNDKWSFETLEHLRKQVAANFNDYCDADSIPTGDVKASEWSITGTTLPNYTGNEKTLYINEVAAILGSIKMKCDKSTGKLTVEDIDFKLLVELVNMYDNSNSDTSKLLDPANLEAVVGIKKLKFKISLYAKYTGVVTYLQSGRQRTAQFTVTVNPSYKEDKYTATVDYEPAAVEEKPVAGFSALSAGGYSFGRTEAIKLTVTQPNADFAKVLEDAARAAVPSSGATYRKYAISQVDVAYRINTKQYSGADDTAGSDFAVLTLAPALLRANKDIVSGSGDSARVVCPKNTGVDFVRFDRTGEMKLGSDNIANVTVVPRINNEGWQHTFKNTYFIGGIEARDPRQNLNPLYATDGSVAEKSDWNLTPTLIAGSSFVSGNVGSTPSMKVEAVSGSTATHEVTAGAKNRSVNPSAPEYVTKADGTAVNIPAARVDKEMAADPAWLGDGVKQHVSTAYIRNAPMVSPWEIGLVHRGREWQTLNIKRAGGFGTAAEVKLDDIDSDYENWTDGGTTYENGDGAILEFIKVGVGCRCMGKIPLALLRKENVGDGDEVTGGNKIKGKYNRDLVKMLFDGIRVGQTVKDFYEESYYAGTAEEENARQQKGGTAKNIDDQGITDFITDVKTLYDTNNFRLRSQFLNSGYGDKNGDITFGMVYNGTDSDGAAIDNDALREEVIGKTVNLLTVGEEAAPNIFRVIVVAQSIKDVGGIGADVPITKLHKGNKRELKCRIGRFDFVSDADNWDYNTYFDEITGETKALVTVERVPAADEAGNKNKDYGRMVVTAIEFID